MYVLINKNSHDVESCDPFAMYVSEDKSKLEEKIKEIFNITENYNIKLENRKLIIKEYLNDQLNKNIENLKQADKLRYFHEEKYRESFEINWRRFLNMAAESVDRKSFEKALECYNFQNIIIFPEHIGELKEPKGYNWSSSISNPFNDDLFINEVEII